MANLHQVNKATFTNMHIHIKGDIRSGALRHLELINGLEQGRHVHHCGAAVHEHRQEPGLDQFIAFHVKQAAHAGAKRDELIEAGFLAVLMHGGPAMMYMTPLLKAIDEFEVAQGA